MNKISLITIVACATLIITLQIGIVMEQRHLQSEIAPLSPSEVSTLFAENPQEAAVSTSKRNQAVVTSQSVQTYKSPASAAQISQIKTAAWIYPGNPSCGALTEYTDGRKIDVLKPEFFTIRGGSLLRLDTTNTQCNGHSPEMITKLKQSSVEQYVTVSSPSANDMETFFTTALLASSTDIEMLNNFVVENGLTGIELDFEDFSSWSPEAYTNYKKFVTLLGTKLHVSGKKLIIDGPAVSNNSEEGWFTWRYADFVSLPVDNIVVMAYDYQYDYGAGAPVAPLDWLHSVIVWTSTKYPKEKLTIGIPSYGYQGTKGSYRITILTNQQLAKKVGYKTATRDFRSGEMTWQKGTTVYFYQDAISMQQKRDVIASLGITSVSVWHLGGNPWF